jgi:hypothetical protein
MAVGSLKDYGYNPGQYTAAMIDSRRRFTDRLSSNVEKIATGITSEVTGAVKAAKKKDELDAERLARGNSLYKDLELITDTAQEQELAKGRDIFKASGVKDAREATGKAVGPPPVNDPIAFAVWEEKANAYASAVMATLTEASQATVFRLAGVKGADPKRLADLVAEGEKRDFARDRGKKLEQDGITRQQYGASVLSTGQELKKDEAALIPEPKPDDPLLGLRGDKMKAEIDAFNRKRREKSMFSPEDLDKAYLIEGRTASDLNRAKTTQTALQRILNTAEEKKREALHKYARENPDSGLDVNSTMEDIARATAAAALEVRRLSERAKESSEIREAVAKNQMTLGDAAQMVTRSQGQKKARAARMQYEERNAEYLASLDASARNQEVRGALEEQGFDAAEIAHAMGGAETLGPDSTSPFAGYSAAVIEAARAVARQLWATNKSEIEAKGYTGPDDELLIKALLQQQ